jgi:hypothetical protein
MEREDATMILPPCEELPPIQAIHVRNHARLSVAEKMAAYGPLSRISVAYVADNETSPLEDNGYISHWLDSAHSGERYLIAWDRNRHIYRCHCPAGVVRHTCWHILWAQESGAMDEWLRIGELAQAMRTQSQAPMPKLDDLVGRWRAEDAQRYPDRVGRGPVAVSDYDASEWEGPDGDLYRF